MSEGGDGTSHLVATALVAIGGFLGATSRYAADLAVGTPVSTFAVNVAGCLAIGVVNHLAATGGVGERVRLAAVTGFVSSFTTYSTFAFELFGLDPALAATYLLASYVLGFAAVVLGDRLARGVTSWR